MGMTEKQFVEKLRVIGEPYHWDTITKKTMMDGRPVYQLRNSNIPRGAKTGFPHYFSYTEEGEIFELDFDQIHRVYDILGL